MNSAGLNARAFEDDDVNLYLRSFSARGASDGIQEPSQQLGHNTNSDLTGSTDIGGCPDCSLRKDAPSVKIQYERREGVLEGESLPP